MMLHASAVAGACAGLVSSIVTCPLDVVKTKLQAQSGPSRPLRSGWSGPAGHPNGGIGGGAAREAWEKNLHDQARAKGVSVAEISSQYEGLSGTMRKIWTENGVKGFYRGLGPTIFGYLPTWAIYFTVYDQCKTFLASNFNPTGEEDFINHILSAMTAGMVSTTCTSPLWVVKTRFMLQSVKDPSTRPYRHTGDAFVQIYRTEGLRGFYRGLLPSLFGVSHVAVQFPLYESFKAWVREQNESDELTPSAILLCSSGAKMIASMLTYPHEVLRTRLQMQPRIIGSVASSPVAAPANGGLEGKISHESGKRTMHTLTGMRNVKARRTRLVPQLGNRQISGMGNVSGQSANRYTGVLQACATIAREEGLRGFYKGMGVNLIRTVPSSALTILTYEVMMQHLTNTDHEQEELNDHKDER
jgi:solute carrier family 25 (mitochondrial folate transporter), member 32